MALQLFYGSPRGEIQFASQRSIAGRDEKAGSLVTGANFITPRDAEFRPRALVCLLTCLLLLAVSSKCRPGVVCRALRQLTQGGGEEIRWAGGDRYLSCANGGRMRLKHDAFFEAAETGTGIEMAWCFCRPVSSYLDATRYLPCLWNKAAAGGIVECMARE